MGPIAAAVVAVSSYTFEARKARSEGLSRRQRGKYD